MRELVVDGGKRLEGEIKIERAKNSVVAVMAAALAVRGEILIEECPKIGDVLIMADILKGLGARTRFKKEGLYVDATNVFSTTLPEGLTEKIRASFFTVGALVGRFGSASCPLPGGCAIGKRPVDIHIEALKGVGVGVGEREGRLGFFAPLVRGGNVCLRYPSVGATENAMLAASLAEGVTVIKNAAREPEIEDLARFLNAAGGRVTGAGTGVIRIDGVKRLSGEFSFKPIEDRVECGTYALAVLAAGGKACLKGANIRNILPLAEKIRNNACQLSCKNDNIYIHSKAIRRGYGVVTTAPWPAFPTDLQPQLVAAAASAQGFTRVTETVFDGRARYVAELLKTGADVVVDGRTISVNGSALKGAEMLAEDLRGGAALVIAALSAEGRSVVKGMEHVERGYLKMDEKLSALGANVRKR